MLLADRTAMHRGRIIDLEARLSRITRGPRHLNFFLLVTILVGSGAGNSETWQLMKHRFSRKLKRLLCS